VFDVYNFLMQDNHYLSLIGILLIIGIAFLCSNNKRKVSIRLILTALLMQFALAYFILNTNTGKNIFSSISSGFQVVYEFADKGSSFVFGSLANPAGPWGFIFAIKVIPIIIFFGALMALLFHLGIVQIFVKALSLLIRPILGTSGAETLSVAANSVLGQTEAPLLIRNYLPRMTQSEILLVMVGGMAHLSGSILAVYGGMGISVLHMLSASIMAIPGAILIAKILIPETEIPETMGGSSVKIPRETKNVLDAISSGTVDGLRLAVNVAAMLIAFISLVALFDYLLFSVTGLFLTNAWTLNMVFGKLFYGVAYFLGISVADREIAGALLGQKLVINEFVAYSGLVKAEVLVRTKSILTYALAGFSNFSCIGIQIGGIGALAANKRELLTRLGMRALLGGTLANLLNAAIASLFI